MIHEITLSNTECMRRHTQKNSRQCCSPDTIHTLRMINGRRQKSDFKHGCMVVSLIVAMGTSPFKTYLLNCIMARYHSMIDPIFRFTVVEFLRAQETIE